MINLEGEKSQAEVVESTITEEAKPTELEVKPTVRTYTQAELDTAVGKGLSSINTQLSVHKTAADTAKAEVNEAKANVQAIEAELQGLQRQHDELVSKQFADDPEARQAYIDKRAIAEDRKKLASEIVATKKAGEVAAKDLRTAMLSRKADALVKETGIELSELEGCQTEEAMEVKALRFKMNKEPEDKKPKFDSGLSSGGDPGWRDLPTDEKLRRGLAQKK